MLNTKQLLSFVLIAASAWPAQNAVAQLVKPGSVVKANSALAKGLDKAANQALKATAKVTIPAVAPKVAHSVYPSQALSFIPSNKAPKNTVLNPKIPVTPRLETVLIYGTERERYAAVREELQNLSIQMPKEQSANIANYLRHSVQIGRAHV